MGPGVTPALSFRVLGPLTMERDGEPVRVGGPKTRVLLAMLLLNAGRVVSVDQFVEALWSDEPPSRATPTLQVHLSNLRKSFGDARPSIITQPPGYVLHAAAGELDLLRFEELVQLARAQRDAGALEPAAALITEALGLWRGPALADIEDSSTVQAARAWLDERRLGAVEDRASVLLALGRNREVIAELDRDVRAHPLRETLWEPLIVALYRSGRQADALAAYGRARRALGDELGIEPGPRLKALELAVLRQDAALDLRSPVGTPVIEPDVTTRAPVRAVGSLVLADGGVFPLADRITIGRHADCDITLVDPSVSRRHAEIRSTLGGFLLIDLSSSNGTRVSSRQVMQQLLSDGDEIEIGGTVLTFVAGRGA